MILTKEEIEILHRAHIESDTISFFTDSEPMQNLIKLGLMQYTGYILTNNDMSFTITMQGHLVHQKHKIPTEN